MFSRFTKIARFIPFGVLCSANIYFDVKKFQLEYRLLFGDKDVIEHQPHHDHGNHGDSFYNARELLGYPPTDVVEES
jgi:hypothetical protein